jgi:hypothetical protein
MNWDISVDMTAVRRAGVLSAQEEISVCAIPYRLSLGQEPQLKAECLTTFSVKAKLT